MKWLLSITRLEWQDIRENNKSNTGFHNVLLYFTLIDLILRYKC
jgi:hypothetical protein